MKIHFKKLELITRKPTQVINITSVVEEYVKECDIIEGVVYIMTKHTTTGLMVNEGLPCVEEDILNHLEKIAPEDDDYVHNHFLPEDGTLGYNANSHIKSVLMGYFLYFPIHKGEMVKGSRQTIYLAELDGPKSREYTIQVIGQ